LAVAERSTDVLFANAIRPYFIRRSTTPFLMSRQNPGMIISPFASNDFMSIAGDRKIA
jgi:hypothetical protein